MPNRSWTSEYFLSMNEVVCLAKSKSSVWVQWKNNPIGIFPYYHFKTLNHHTATTTLLKVSGNYNSNSWKLSVETFHETILGRIWFKPLSKIPNANRIFFLLKKLSLYSALDVLYAYETPFRGSLYNQNYLLIQAWKR